MYGYPNILLSLILLLLLCFSNTSKLSNALLRCNTVHIIAPRVYLELGKGPENNVRMRLFLVISIDWK